MFFLTWLGIIIAGAQSGCTTAHVASSPIAPGIETRRAVTPDTHLAPITAPRGLRNLDSPQIPKVPPPGARNSYSSVHVNGPYLAITFDDGPHPQNTPRLLGMLRERNIKATFFVVGSLAKEYPGIIRAILADGHEIGNHTLTHPLNMTRLSDEKIRHEVGATADALQEIAGYHARLFRPPGGATNARIKQWLYDEYGLCNILWSVDPNDWKRPGVSVVTQRLVNGAHPGAILLCHDLHAPTVDAMPGTLDALLAKGYRFVTVSQLLNMETAATTMIAPAAPEITAPATTTVTTPPAEEL
ncbi:MAG: polysaccharide deacetylase family protein [Verrucomicrobia bacterium]|nr:polysaccharide deacetylase family protein [Verrucomicrobiota bacterium]